MASKGSELTDMELDRIAGWLPDCPLCKNGYMGDGELCVECRGCNANPSAIATVAVLIAEREQAAEKRGREAERIRFQQAIAAEAKAVTDFHAAEKPADCDLVWVTAHSMSPTELHALADFSEKLRIEHLKPRPSEAE